MDLIKYFENKKLLADGKSNVKLAKNEMRTYGLSLLPHTLNSSGVNLCKFSTKECRKSCLNLSGRAAFDSVQKARLYKTDFFIQHRGLFLNRLWNELAVINKKENAAVRLNVVSDVNWELEFNKIGKSLITLTNIIKYDYTKDGPKVDWNPDNGYHFTFSFSGGNWNWCEKFLQEKKANVAVVFKNNPPNEWKNFRVIDGVKSDERFLDEKGVIVGLKYKIPRGVKYEKNKFVVENEEKRENNIFI